jgi:hypothetical protein
LAGKPAVATANTTPSGAQGLALAAAIVDNVAQQSGGDQSPAANAASSLQPVLAASGEPASRATDVGASHTNGSAWLLWAGPALVVLTVLAFIAWYGLRRKEVA